MPRTRAHRLIQLSEWSRPHPGNGARAQMCHIEELAACVNSEARSLGTISMFTTHARLASLRTLGPARLEHPAQARTAPGRPTLLEPVTDCALGRREAKQVEPYHTVAARPSEIGSYCDTCCATYVSAVTRTRPLSQKGHSR
jgi:hypothetical protein